MQESTSDTWVCGKQLQNGYETISLLILTGRVRRLVTSCQVRDDILDEVLLSGFPFIPGLFMPFFFFLFPFEPDVAPVVQERNSEGMSNSCIAIKHPCRGGMFFLEWETWTKGTQSFNSLACGPSNHRLLEFTYVSSAQPVLVFSLLCLSLFNH